ncbi:MAG: hypothetical protein ICV64_00540 [Thermoleophilia bacterium]|nr:hypothetical protein [Thermoleophilia bacterium]
MAPRTLISVDAEGRLVDVPCPEGWQPSGPTISAADFAIPEGWQAAQLTSSQGAGTPPAHLPNTPSPVEQLPDDQRPADYWVSLERGFVEHALERAAYLRDEADVVEWYNDLLGLPADQARVHARALRTEARMWAEAARPRLPTTVGLGLRVSGIAPVRRLTRGRRLRPVARRVARRPSRGSPSRGDPSPSEPDLARRAA